MEKKDARNSSNRTGARNTFRKSDDKKTSENVGSGFAKRKDKESKEYNRDFDDTNDTKKRTYSRKDTDKDVKNARTFGDTRNGDSRGDSKYDTSRGNDRPKRNDDRPFRDRPKPYGDKREFGGRKERSDSFGEKKFVR